MGWEPLTASLERWFADAWTRGLHPAAEDLAWIIAMLRHPRLTVTPGLRAVLDATADGSTDDDPSEALADDVIEGLATELRRAIERHGRVGERRRTYRLVRDAADASRARSP